MRDRMLCVLVVSTIIVLSWASALADEEHSLEARLTEITTQIAGHTTEIETLQQRFQKLTAEQSVLQRSVSEIQTSLVQTKKKLIELEAKRRDVEDEAAQTNQRLDSLESLTLLRVRALGMQQKSRLFEQLFLTAGEETFAYRAFLLQKIREHDAHLTEELQRLFAEKRDQILVLESLIKQQKQVEEEIGAQQRTLTIKSKKLEQVKMGLTQERKKIQSGIASLRAESLRLETVMVGLTGGDQGASNAPNASAERANGNTSSVPVAFQGKGLTSLGHRPPLEGNVVRRFGATSGKAGGVSLLKTKGLEMVVKEDSQVRAIETGRVIFNGIMPGYGLIVIIDHGDREYSLYGRLAKSSVDVGDIISRDSTFAHVIGQRGGDANFYFEIRKNGKPVDPGLFIRAYR